MRPVSWRKASEHRAVRGDLILPGSTGRAERMPSQDLLLRQPLSKAVTFICLQIGIWQRCQISRLFREDAQGAQVINLSILPR